MPLFELTDLARTDLDRISDYIGDHNLAAAERILEQFHHAFELLASQPEMGMRDLQLAKGRYRRFVVGKYVIYYEPYAGGIRVSRVLHGAHEHGPLL